MVKHRTLPLASPFTSRSSSPSSVTVAPLLGNGNYLDADKSPRKTLRSRHRPSSSDTVLTQQLNNKRTGAEAHIKSQTFASQSILGSLTQVNHDVTSESLLYHRRRPSAPSASSSIPHGFALSTIAVDNARNERDYDSHDLNLDLDVDSSMTYLFSFDSLCDSRTCFLSSLGGTVDFNRPPSQMSSYVAESDSDFARDLFTQIRGRSTPNRARALSLLPPSFPSSQHNDTPHDGVTTKRRTDAQKAKENLYSPWISDSIISPPSYHNRRKDKASSLPGLVQQILDDMELSMSCFFLRS